MSSITLRPSFHPTDMLTRRHLIALSAAQALAPTNTALTDPTIKDKLAKTGYVAEGSSPEELEKLLKSEIAKWSAVIKSVGIKID
jgi:hypothetical protein